MNNTEEKLWLVEFENDEHQPVYIQAETEKQAGSVARRMFDRKKYDFNWTQCISIEETSKRNPEEAVKGRKPYRAIVPYKYHMVQYEKRVNQVGSKGVYYTKLYY
jgi:hypothetical protein